MFLRVVILEFVLLSASRPVALVRGRRVPRGGEYALALSDVVLALVPLRRTGFGPLTIRGQVPEVCKTGQFYFSVPAMVAAHRGTVDENDHSRASTSTLRYVFL